ncbi:hypothetical protein F5Y04DRAFT_105281 [Hypomontagnella monticulosa]|nr:hypothetical protein F5Y04DRAFT_105281 [Hypomontagnella monticulosa]
MPPHLHPRSRMTSSLFATTVAACFIVVTLPHILPCPAPRVTYADSEMSPDGTRRRRRRRPEPAVVKDGIVQFESPNEELDRIATETGIAATRARRERECPVPKPGGVIGELMGFNKAKTEEKKGGNDNT